MSGSTHASHGSGLHASDTPEQRSFALAGLQCVCCAAGVQGMVRELPGVATANVDFAAERLDVTYDPRALSEADIRRAVREYGYGFRDEADGRTTGELAHTAQMTPVT